MQRLQRPLGTAALLGITFVVAGCGGGSSPSTPPLPPEAPEPPPVGFAVDVVNLTAGQTLSPPHALVSQTGRGPIWQIGAPASEALEALAESGSGVALTAEALSDAAGTGPLEPGGRVTIEFEATEDALAAGRRLGVVAMLLDTNDAFTGFTDLDLGTIRSAAGRTWSVPAYDAGTEPNDEAAVAIPGPASGGEGFDPSRDGDVNFVHRHPGVLTRHELPGSALDPEHRFDNPVARVTVRRTTAAE